jgi:hypothetical protein
MVAAFFSSMFAAFIRASASVSVSVSAIYSITN